MSSSSWVTIVIPCYNDGQYLLEAIASAQAQTHPLTEIIVVDDHSTDPQTLAIYENLQNQGIAILQTPPCKKGPSAARNTGIAAATGEYILPLDADDAIAPSYISKAVAVLDANPAVGICYCNARFFGLKSGPWSLPPYSFKELLCGNIIFATALFRKSDWSKFGGYDENLTLGLEDYAFWLQLTNGGTGVYRLEEELFFYRIKSGSRSAQLAHEDKQIRALEMVYESCSDIYSRHCGVLLQKIAILNSDHARQKCLFSWKACAPLFRMEWLLRQRIKKILGRC